MLNPVRRRKYRGFQAESFFSIRCNFSDRCGDIISGFACRVKAWMGALLPFGHVQADHSR